MQNHELLKDFPHKFQLAVQWGDMDAFRHVNNVRYLSWFESARVDYLERLNSLKVSAETSTGVILGSIQCKYLFPVTYPDTIEMGVRIENLEPGKFDMVCHMVSQKHQKLVAIAKAKIVIYDYAKFAKAEMSEETLQEIKTLEGMS